MSHRSPDSFSGPPTFFDVFPRAPTYDLRALDAVVVHAEDRRVCFLCSLSVIRIDYITSDCPRALILGSNNSITGETLFSWKNDNMRCDREKSFARAIYAAVRRSVRRKKSRRRFYGLRHGRTARNYILFLFYRPCDVRDLQGVLRRQFPNAFTNRFQ